MGNGVLHLCVFIYFLALTKQCNCNAINGNEPTCLSWYDFAQKLLERTITAELKVKQMESLLGDMEASRKLQEAEVNRLKSEIASEREEMKAEVGGVINTAQDQVARLSSDLRAFQGKVNSSLQLQFEELGIAGGSYFRHPGGQSNIICLPEDPIFSNYHASQHLAAFIYGVEYQGEATDRTEAIFGTNVADQDVPCAVCEATGRRSKMLVPARNVCYSGWHLEYSGYLMTAHPSHHRTTIECVDANTEGVRGQSTNNEGELFYFAEASGQIPDPPYTKGKELTCAICTK